MNIKFSIQKENLQDHKLDNAKIHREIIEKYFEKSCLCVHVCFCMCVWMILFVFVSKNPYMYM